ncbi:hypothetical protein [Acinetobacter guillouiae]|uniref:hypothetical protein n=1 Tax=Acinetobacter guillouiae TaxID=106649 RepID=UPI0028E2062C|nr:hypothetical protein [Acinetobacter guillouiae]
MTNPEIIEIEGLKTIHKLCKFAADRNMEGSSFTEIVERMFEELNKPRRVVTLTCSELLEAFQFGAPDGEGDEDQMATDMTIEWFEDGHSGKGYYAYYSELPEEGAIKLGEGQSHDNSN